MIGERMSQKNQAARLKRDHHFHELNKCARQEDPVSRMLLRLLSSAIASRCAQQAYLVSSKPTPLGLESRPEDAVDPVRWSKLTLPCTSHRAWKLFSMYSIEVVHTLKLIPGL